MLLIDYLDGFFDGLAVVKKGFRQLQPPRLSVAVVCLQLAVFFQLPLINEITPLVCPFLVILEYTVHGCILQTVGNRLVKVGGYFQCLEVVDGNDGVFGGLAGFKCLGKAGTDGIFQHVDDRANDATHQFCTTASQKLVDLVQSGWVLLVLLIFGTIVCYSAVRHSQFVCSALAIDLLSDGHRLRASPTE